MRVIFLLCTLAILSESEFAIAQFNDQGLVTAKSRTDYNSQTEGLSSNPITYINPCLFPSSPTGCGNSPPTFSNTNWFFQNVSGAYPAGSFWVLDFNNEPAYNTSPLTTTNPGPPNQSIQRSAPGYGVMGYTALKDTPAGENYYRAHLVANGFFPNPNPFGDGIPYLGIGAERLRGNNTTYPGVLNSATGRKKVQFVAKLWDIVNPTQITRSPGPPPVMGYPPTLTFYVTARTFWGGQS